MFWFKHASLCFLYDTLDCKMEKGSQGRAYRFQLNRIKQNHQLNFIGEDTLHSCFGEWQKKKIRFGSLIKVKQFLSNLLKSKVYKIQQEQISKLKNVSLPI